MLEIETTVGITDVYDQSDVFRERGFIRCRRSCGFEDSSDRTRCLLGILEYGGELPEYAYRGPLLFADASLPQ